MNSEWWNGLQALSLCEEMGFLWVKSLRVPVCPCGMLDAYYISGCSLSEQTSSHIYVFALFFLGMLARGL